MKYIPGDKAKVREDLEEGRFYGGQDFTEGMLSFRGLYVTIREVYRDFYIIEELGCRWTDEMFEEEEKVIKISKWEDLNARKNEKYVVFVDYAEQVLVVNIRPEIKIVSEMDYANVEKKIILDWLKLFGFEVEFEHPKKINERLYHLCLAFPDWWIVRDLDGRVYMHKHKPIIRTEIWAASYEPVCVPSYEPVFVPSEKEVPIEWKDEPINTNEMAKMYVEQELEE